jgi:hypothetical protein
MDPSRLRKSGTSRRILWCAWSPRFIACCVFISASSASERALSDEADQRNKAAVHNPHELTAWLDERFTSIWRDAGVDVMPVDDATYLRRVYLDLVGRIPSVSESHDFLKDESPRKRERLVETLLVDVQNPNRNSAPFAVHFARLWRRVMLPTNGTSAGLGRQFETWLTNEFRENRPYDEMTRRLLVARGEDAGQASAFYTAVGGNPESYATAFSRVFLGVRLGCAQCHNHPFSNWTKKDFWGMAAFFAGTTNGQPGAPVAQRLEETRKTTITYDGVEYAAKFLWGDEADIAATKLPREMLSQWMTSSNNRNFAATAVNRIWQALCGRGLVPEVDNLDQATNEDREPVLNELARRFAENSYDINWLVRGICASRAYQCPSASAVGTEASLYDGSRSLKVLTSEQVFDSLEQALLLPVTRSNAASARYNGMRTQMVSRLDESLGDSPEEYGAGIPQVLMLMNGPLTADAISVDRSRTLKGVIDAPFLDETSKIDTLYLAVLTRYPTEKERDFLLQHIRIQTTPEDRRAAYDEVLWALLNSPEFVLCR